MELNLQALTVDRDDRLRSYCVTAKCSYADFLALTTGAETNLDIQRKIIKGVKAYATLRADLKRGCILPPIVLAANVSISRPLEELYLEQNIPALTESLRSIENGSVYVIDGLQRTNAIRQTLDELEEHEKADFLARNIRVEIWLNVPFGAIAYRMLLLNAGQRPMSVKQQVEVLSAKLVSDLRSIPNLEIFRFVDARRRTQPGQFSLAKISQAFQAWLQGQPNLDLRNTVMEEMLAESAIEVLGHTISGDPNQPDTDGFKKFFTWLVDLDVALGADNVSFLGNETVILGIAAAVGALERSETLSNRVWPSLDNLLARARSNTPGDALALSIFEALRKGIDSSKVNVGVATRDMAFNCFKEFVRGAGETPMSECWQIGAARP